MKNKGITLISILALVFGIVFLRDFYRPNCAGAACIKWPTLKILYGWNGKPPGGWGSSNPSPTGIPGSGYNPGWVPWNDEAPFMAGMSMRSMGQNGDGGYCWGSNHVDPSWSWTYYEGGGWTNNDKVWCIFNFFGWRNYYP